VSLKGHFYADLSSGPSHEPNRSATGTVFSEPVI